jgi:hypothetical protein
MRTSPRMLGTAVALVAGVGCGKHPAATTGNASVIPTTTAALQIDGELGEPDWSQRALRHVFTTVTGEQARPFSEVRMLHDARNLYVGLYAADEDIRSREFFELQIGELRLHALATGTISSAVPGTPAVPGITAAIDRDGTLDDPSNDDEEWVLEIVIPLAATNLAPGQPRTARAARCDTPKDGVERCGAWTGTVQIE